MKTKKPKADPTKDSATFPYMLVKKYADHRYFRSWKDAREAIVKELTALRDGFELMGWKDSIAAVNDRLQEAGCLLPEQGGIVSGVVDPLSGQRYCVDLVKRDQLQTRLDF